MFLALLLLLFGASAEAGQLRVAVVDTGLDLTDKRFAPHLCVAGHQDFTGTGMKDTHSHGTHVAGIIVRNAGNSNYCLIILKYYDHKRAVPQFPIEAFRRAVELGVDIVNFSGGGPGNNDSERSVIENAPYVRFVVAAGNNGKRLESETFFFPASYRLPNVDVVGNLTLNGERNSSSNYGPTVTHWEVGTDVLSFFPNGEEGVQSGTSQAAAVRTGKLIKKLSRGK